MVVSMATFLLPVLVRRAARMHDTPFRLYICRRVGARGVPIRDAGWGSILPLYPFDLFFFFCATATIAWITYRG